MHSDQLKHAARQTTVHWVFLYFGKAQFTGRHLAVKWQRNAKTSGTTQWILVDGSDAVRHQLSEVMKGIIVRTKPHTDSSRHSLLGVGVARHFGLADSGNFASIGLSDCFQLFGYCLKLRFDK